MVSRSNVACLLSEVHPVVISGLKDELLCSVTHEGATRRLHVQSKLENPEAAGTHLSKVLYVVHHAQHPEESTLI